MSHIATKLEGNATLLLTHQLLLIRAIFYSNATGFTKKKKKPHKDSGDVSMVFLRQSTGNTRAEHNVFVFSGKTNRATEQKRSHFILNSP